MPPALTPGAIEKILTSAPDAPPLDPRPTLQVFDLKELKSKTTDASGGPRFRLLASDGAHATQGLFAQGLNAKCAAGEIVKYSILRVRDYVLQDVNGKKCVGASIERFECGGSVSFRVRSRRETTDGEFPTDARARRVILRWVISKTRGENLVASEGRGD
jgi:hypothetical protein